MIGDFDFSDEKLQDTTGVLRPKKQTEIIPENWSRQIDDTNAVSKGYRKSYGGLGTFASLAQRLIHFVQTLSISCSHTYFFTTYW